MRSKRFPGKVLAPFAGRPIIAHVIERVAAAVPRDQITVATSTEQSDDPLACYVQQLGVSVYRGSLNDVFGRFQLCLREYPCAWFFRICADSPLLDSTMLQTMLAYSERTDVDLVTNIYLRTFPKGQSVEMLNSKTFAAIDSGRLSLDDKEHVTKFYYDHPSEFRIFNIESSHPELANTSLVVDTLEDLRRLEETLFSQLPVLARTS